MSIKKHQKSTPSKLEMYDLIRAPRITEKTTLISEHNQITFQVAMTATKQQIKAAVETLFKVRVMAVNTMIQKGKTKRVRNIPGRRADIKKAIVTLNPDDRLDITTGL
jgi:large subunit ribosomal protein L23